MIQQGLVPGSILLSPHSDDWNYGETETGTNPAWADLSKERQLDLARRMAIYAAMVDRMDQHIGRLIEDLKAKGEFENTLLIFTSDNGASTSILITREGSRRPVLCTGQSDP